MVTNHAGIMENTEMQCMVLLSREAIAVTVGDSDVHLLLLLFWIHSSPPGHASSVLLPSRTQQGRTAGAGPLCPMWDFSNGQPLLRPPHWFQPRLSNTETLPSLDLLSLLFSPWSGGLQALPTFSCSLPLHSHLPYKSLTEFICLGIRFLEKSN